MRPAVAIAVVLAVALCGCGCGVGAGAEPAGTRLTITRDFGAHRLRVLQAPAVGGGETAMRLLQRNARVTTRFGGGFVQSIDGLSGGTRDGHPVDWFYYVNGIEASVGAAATRLRSGDQVWWDRHDWTATQTVPAVVGAFPEPFRHGIGGKRLPVRVECATPGSDPCRRVSAELASFGVPAATGGLQIARADESLRVLVGPWSALRSDPAVETLEGGPALSGVYARPARDGRTIAALDARGRAARTLGAGTGLVAATRRADRRPAWVVTGTDAAGVDAAARAFDRRSLSRRFALAVAGGRPLALPVAR